MWRDEQISALENIRQRSEHENEILRTLKLERDFEKRAREGDGEEDESEGEESEEEGASGSTAEEEDIVDDDDDDEGFNVEDIVTEVNQTIFGRKEKNWTVDE